MNLHAIKACLFSTHRRCDELVLHLADFVRCHIIGLDLLKMTVFNDAVIRAKSKLCNDSRLLRMLNCVFFSMACYYADLYIIGPYFEDKPLLLFIMTI